MCSRCYSLGRVSCAGTALVALLTRKVKVSSTYQVSKVSTYCVKVEDRPGDGKSTSGEELGDGYIFAASRVTGLHLQYVVLAIKYLLL